MFNITIDGFGGCGKSTIAEGLAKRFNFRTLNTGAIYRAFACAYLDNNLPLQPNETIIHEFVSRSKIEVFFVNEVQHVSINGKDYTDNLREEKISYFTSIISPYEELRNAVKIVQKDFAQKHNCIIEGRGVGIDVLPNADLKLFLIATPQVRAMRRYEQIKNKPNAPTFEEVLEDLIARDYADEHREHGANIPAKDAVIFDNTNMSLEESLDYLEKLVRDKMK